MYGLATIGLGLHALLTDRTDTLNLYSRLDLTVGQKSQLYMLTFDTKLIL